MTMTTRKKRSIKDLDTSMPGLKHSFPTEGDLSLPSGILEEIAQRGDETKQDMMLVELVNVYGKRVQHHAQRIAGLRVDPSSAEQGRYWTQVQGHVQTLGKHLHNAANELAANYQAVICQFKSTGGIPVPPRSTEVIKILIQAGATFPGKPSKRQAMLLLSFDDSALQLMGYDKFSLQCIRNPQLKEDIARINERIEICHKLMEVARAMVTWEFPGPIIESDKPASRPVKESVPHY